MHLNSIQRQFFKFMLAALLAATASSMFSQVAPAVRSAGTSHLAVGGGAAYYNVDWGRTRMLGYTLWADWRPPLLPRYLNGLHLELEGRDLLWNQGDKPPGFRQMEGSGGVMYEWRHFRRFRPYGKGLIGFGGIYFGKDQGGIPSKPYTHDTRTVYVPGGGFEYRIAGNLWARADYEYQFWPKLTGNTFLNPQGFTFGAMYDLKDRQTPLTPGCGAQCNRPSGSSDPLRRGKPAQAFLTACPKLQRRPPGQGPLRQVVVAGVDDRLPGGLPAPRHSAKP